MDKSYSTTYEKAHSASDAISGTIERASNTPVGHAAQGMSESHERHDSREPVNSLMRTILLSSAGMAIATSLAMQFTGRKHEAVFVGQWAPTLLIIALWYQVVKGQQRLAHAPGDVQAQPSLYH